MGRGPSSGPECLGVVVTVGDRSRGSLDWGLMEMVVLPGVREGSALSLAPGQGPRVPYVLCFSVQAIWGLDEVLWSCRAGRPLFPSGEACS